jgi:hypothetical protein
MSADFLTDSQVQNYGRYAAEPNEVQLARYFHLDERGVSLDIENYCTLSSFFNHFWFFWKRNILDVKTVMRGH